MLGKAFAPTMRAAQAGDERAFARLWRDANPPMVRYLRVMGVQDPYDSACEGWVSIVRGVGSFDGDEKDWRLWVCTCARMCAEDRSLRSSWSPFKHRNGAAEPEPAGPDDLDLDDLFEAAVGDDPVHRDVNATITALRALPMGQGEVVDLRWGWGLPPEDVAGLVGLDSTKVARAEARALERLETPADLLEWSLNAPPTPAELADERIATAAFRSTPRGSRHPVGQARIIALGSAVRPRATSARSGHSPAALLGIAALSASMMSVGGLSAAAYVGALPAPVQQVAHDVIGAPAPVPTVQAPGATTVPGRGVPTVAVGTQTPAEAAPGLCRAWATDHARGLSRGSSPAFRDLARAAGGDAGVQGYCATALAAAPRPGNGTTPGPHASGKPGNKGKTAPTAGTATPPGHSPTAKPGTTKTTGHGGPPTAPPGHTKTPGTTEPVATEPVATKPVTTKPVATKPVATKAPRPSSTKADRPGSTGSVGESVPAATAPFGRTG